MGKVYLLYYDYCHTRGNHAGMAYLARAMQASNRSIRLIKHPEQEYRGGWLFAYMYALGIAAYLKFVLRRGDQVLFFEYLSGDFGYQDTIARLLRQWGCNNYFSGLVHLGGDQLMSLYKTPAAILRRLDYTDRILVFGSSLKTFLSDSVGYRKPIVRTYHYAETTFYVPSSKPHEAGAPLQVLVLGKLKRNADQLAAIIERTKGIAYFHVCAGRSAHASIAHFPHVRIYPALSEVDLRGLMQLSDVNLSVFYDTVGSNAVTSTLACGLVQVASHVGSIEDYGDSTNSIWCECTDDFVNALAALAHDEQRLRKMQKSARAQAERISLANSVNYFNTLLVRPEQEARYES